MSFQRLGRLLKNLEDIFAWIAIAILVAITTAVCLEVLMRYAFNSPIYFVVELSEYGLLYITFLGAGWVLRENGHVRIEIFLFALDKTWRHRMGILSSSFGVIVSFVLLFYGTSRTVDAYSRGLFRATIVEFPSWIVLIVIPLGSLVLLGRFTQRFVGHWQQTEEDEDLVMLSAKSDEGLN